MSNGITNMKDTNEDVTSSQLKRNPSLDERSSLIDSIADNAMNSRNEDDNNEEPIHNDPSYIDGVPGGDDDPLLGIGQDSELSSSSTPAKLYKLKINGKIMEFTEEELIARAQKVESADDYLRRAAEAARDARPQPPSTPPVDTAKAAREAQERDDTEDLAIIRAIQVGTEYEGVQAIKRLRERVQFQQDVVQRQIQTEIYNREVISQIEKDYSDVVNDPVLRDLFVRGALQLAQSNPDVPFKNRLEISGNAVRTWLKGVREGTGESSSATAETTDGQRLAAKQMIPTPIGRKGVRHPPPVETDNIDDDTYRKRAIASIAKSRGQERPSYETNINMKSR